MSDNQFEDEQVNFDSPDEGFDEFQSGGGSSLGELWRSNPLVKIGVIAGVLITVIGAVVLFGGQDSGPAPSRVKATRDLSDTPGQDAVSTVMREAIEEKNEQTREQALRTGESAIPTPINTPVTRLELPEDDAAIEDPLERWRRIQEERQRQLQQQVPEIETGDPNVEAIDALANAMLGQMEGILKAKSEPILPLHLEVTEAGWLESLEDDQADNNGAGSDPVNPDADVVNILIPAGTIEYAQLLTEANSDADAPVLAQIVSGPLAGSRLIGTFQTEDDFLVITFNTIVVDGIALGTEAMAINPETTTPGMVTDIDRRYFTRVILPAAAAFVEGMGEAIADQGSTNVTVSGDTVIEEEEDLDTTEEIYKGVEEAASKISEILDENAENTDPLIRVEAGTPMGLVFLQPVVEEATQ